jgi:hypothetical protein
MQTRGSAVGAEAAHVVHDQDVGVIHRGRGARLGLEPAQPLGIVGDVRRQDLDRDTAPVDLQPGVFGFGFQQDGDVRVRVLPERKEGLVRLARLHGLTGLGMGAAQI